MGDRASCHCQGTALWVPENVKRIFSSRKSGFTFGGMTTPDITPILEELAAGLIDAAEAARRIDALKASESSSEEQPQEPTNEELAASVAESDAWAAVTDQPQQGGYGAQASEPEETVSEETVSEEPVSEEPVRT